MNPILLYPQNASQVRFIRETAESKGMEMVSISKKLLEEIDDMLFAERMVRAHKHAKIVPEAKMRKLINDKLAGK